MAESILFSVKRGIGLDPTYKSNFDGDLILHINTVFSILNQLGVGPEEGFSILGKEETWADFLGNDPRLSLVESYMCMQVKLLFDPPQNSALFEALRNSIKELEWRINVVVDPGDQN